MFVNKKILAIVLLSFTFLVFGTGVVLAAGLCEPCNGDPCDHPLTCEDGKCRGCPTGSGIVTICNPLQACDIQELIEKIINFILNLMLVITPIMIVYAGFLFLTAAGDPIKVNLAKKVLLWTLIGLCVILLSKGLIAILKSMLY